MGIIIDPQNRQKNIKKEKQEERKGQRGESLGKKAEERRSEEKHKEEIQRRSIIRTQREMPSSGIDGDSHGGKESI